ncbi:hypothetical protein [Archangium lipolyticum]|uniref:hypothetical protein n=1 Tax=Archangium lipolyticum TaxID=2970465 RepID=UPI002149FF20|nr:hypothetical protein [Archangium lipolyticum]
MAHEKDDGLSPLVFPRSSSRPVLPRTPPRVWPPVSPADMGRVVRRLKVAERPRAPEPEVPLLGTGT